MTTTKQQTLASLAFATALTVTQVSAQDFKTEEVQFKSGDNTLSGLLFLPAERAPGEKVEGVVVTGAWTTIKEQMPSTYAEELAKRGMAALVFDFATWGESTGETKSLESPTLKTKDIRSAVDYLSTRDEVLDINGLGICASAGYMVNASLDNNNLSSIALVAPWLHNKEIVEQTYGDKEAVQELISTGQSAQKKEAESGEPQLIPAAGDKDSDALMAGAEYYTEKDRGQIPKWDNTFNLASWEGWLTFDPIKSAPKVQQPTLIVHSEKAAIPQGARQFYKDLKAPKEQLWLDGVGQFDFYDQKEPVSKSVDAAVAHFNTY